MSPDASVLRLPAIEAHELWAETYDRGPNPLLALEERIVWPLLPNLKEMAVIDVACGTGRWLASLLAHGAREAVGLDISPRMLRQACGKPSLRGRLIHADCTEMPVQRAAADLVMCSFGAGYVEDLCGFARELARILRPRGHLFLSDFHPSARLRGWKRGFRHNADTIEILSFDYSVDRVCEAFAAEGFERTTLVQPRFGEPERPVFEQCGRGHLFSKLCEDTAVFVCHFRRNGDPPLKG